ncbi:hypothetical protein [Paenibacillus sp. Z3-2]
MKNDNKRRVSMAGCPSLHYVNVTKKGFEQLRKEGRKHGFALPNSPSGKFTVSASGANLSFAYKWTSDMKLELQCTKKPPSIPCSAIRSFADNVVQSIGGQRA